MRPDAPREPFAGPDAGPEPPFPIKLSGPVIKGFGRGSKELGIPTANIPPEGLSAYPDLQSGVYYGFVGLRTTPATTQASSSSSHSSSTTNPTTKTTSTSAHQIYPCVLSIGYNPFYANKTRSVEIHLLHTFTHDFYGSALNLLMLGFIRPEYDYVSVDALVEDIRIDCEVAARSLARSTYAEYQAEKWLAEFAWADGLDVGEVEREVLNKDGAAGAAAAGGTQKGIEGKI